MILQTLINFPESDWLDFKLKWHENLADLVLDILCLANSDADGDRYLVFGVDDKDKSKIISPTQNRKNIEELIDFLSKRHFNRLPTISLQTISIDNSEIDVLTIKKTRYRPYFLTQDYRNSKTLVRAGVVYTRNGMTNTPKDSCASENQIADMWRERFGLTLSPFDRLQIYIQDTNNWKQFSNPFIDDNIFSFYYAPFPEFTIDFKNISFADYAKDVAGNIKHSRTYFGNTIGASADSCYAIKYFTTIIADGTYTIMDNHRKLLINPDSRFVWYSKKSPMTEIHVETEESFVTDTGLNLENGLSEINSNQVDYGRTNFGFHKEGSFKHALQKILDPNAYEVYFIPEDEEKTRNIYLVPKHIDTTVFAREEMLKLFRNNLSSELSEEIADD